MSSIPSSNNKRSNGAGSSLSSWLLATLLYHRNTPPPTSHSSSTPFNSTILPTPSLNTFTTVCSFLLLNSRSGSPIDPAYYTKPSSTPCHLDPQGVYRTTLLDGSSALPSISRFYHPSNIKFVASLSLVSSGRDQFNPVDKSRQSDRGEPHVFEMKKSIDIIERRVSLKK